ncbi:MAG: radical SAM protein [Deltaproteobacteria bacterium]|nr:radical SAM protein [Deltaproteobacteria bacterium]
MKQGHELTDETVYGPVVSRRYGRTLGINLLPSKKHCSFNCVYCQLGWNDSHYRPTVDEFPSLEKVIHSLSERLAELRPGTLNYIVLSGNGEPTLHPQFRAVVEGIFAEVRQYSTKIPMVILTSGTTLVDPSIVEVLEKFDECAVKWDARWGRVNLPVQAFESKAMIAILQNLPNLVLQSCFFKGKIENCGEAWVKAWCKEIMEINPKWVDIYTLARGTSLQGLIPLQSQELHNIATALAAAGFDRARVVSP